MTSEEWWSSYNRIYVQAYNNDFCLGLFDFMIKIYKYKNDVCGPDLETKLLFLVFPLFYVSMLEFFSFYYKNVLTTFWTNAQTIFARCQIKGFMNTDFGLN